MGHSILVLHSILHILAKTACHPHIAGVYKICKTSTNSKHNRQASPWIPVQTLRGKSASYALKSNWFLLLLLSISGKLGKETKPDLHRCWPQTALVKLSCSECVCVCEAKSHELTSNRDTNGSALNYITLSSYLSKHTARAQTPPASWASPTLQEHAFCLQAESLLISFSRKEKT